MIPPLEHPPIAPRRGRVCGKQLAREPVEEAPTGLRPSGKDGEILPPKGDGARPRASLSHHRPGPVLAGSDGAANGPRGVGALDLAIHGRARRIPAGELESLGAAEGAPYEEQTESFEEVGLALAVRASDDVQRRGRRIGQRSVTAKIRQRYPFDLHPGFAPPPPKSAWAL